MTASTAVALVCKHCQASFSRPAWVTRKAGGGTYCSHKCSNAAKKRIAADQAAKFGRTSYPTKHAPTIAPAAWQWPIENSATVTCPRCSRERARGQRCSCERPQEA